MLEIPGKGDYLMGKEAHQLKENGGMIPKSVLTGVIRDTVKTQSDEKIIEFADILYSGFARWGDHESRLGEHSSRLDQQHADITRAIDSMNAGFAAVNQRFDDLLGHSNKRFEAVDKRFDDMLGTTNKRFEAVDKRFEAMDKRFDDLIHHMDKRFSTLTWAIGIAFIVINITMVVLKVF
ncbi:MAG: hypothetical protein KBA61_04140 [Spirochaetes bacterium]|nr:hypothetical protein [Spirochaetota bacterium]